MLLKNRPAAAALALLLPLALSACNRDSGTPATPPPPPTPAAAPAANPNAATTPTTARAAAAVPSFVASFQDLAGPVKPDPILAQCIQTVTGFNHPSGVAISPDATQLFVANSASTLNGIEYHKGGLSKLEIGPDGRLKMLNPRFLEGLHSPRGMAFLPKATKAFPTGSLFVAVGATSACDDKGDRITDITKFNPGVAVFAPDTGKQLGFIAMGPKRGVALSLRHPVLVPAGICFSPEGDLFVADSGNTGRELEPDVIGRPGILRLRNADLDAFASGDSKPRVDFLIERHWPAAIFYSKADDALYWTTCDGQGPAGGAVNRMPRGDFPEQNMVKNVLGAEGLGPLMGVVITPGGSLVASRVDGDLTFMTRTVLDTVQFSESAAFASPFEIKLLPLPRNYNVLYVPEQEPSAPEPWKQRVRVILLPSNL